jgi:hypothetical protein
VLQLTKHSLSSSFWSQKSIVELDHPPWSSDLALCDFRLFPKIKSALQGWRFQDTEDIKKLWQLYGKLSTTQVLKCL